MRKTVILVVLAVTAGALALVLGLTRGSAPAGAADHLDAPLVKKDGRTDINDVYVFHPGSQVGSSQDLDRTVLAMTVNPLAGVISGTTFRDGASYEFLIDADGDAVEDATIRVKFSGVNDQGDQNYTVHWFGLGKNGLIAKGSTGEVAASGDVQTFAGTRDDPFFFDLANFNNGATFCGSGLPVADFFLGLNSSAIVLEVPTEWIGDEVGVWGRTVVDGRQIERMGRPAILTVFIPPNPFEAGSTALGNLEDQFNATEPRNDQALWRAEVVNSLLALGNTMAQANAMANVLLPDILTVDLSQETGFVSGLSGRNLEDDVIDAELGLITNGAITSDCVNNDSTFLAGFPYLGVPNN
jgi:hypothetical protein